MSPSSAALPPPCWRLNPRVQLLWRQLDDEWVLFEALSGQTHQMDAYTAAVLMAFEPGQPLSLQALLAGMATDLGMALDDAARAAVLSVIDQLAALGLLLPLSVNHAAG